MGEIIYIHTSIHDCDNITGQVLSIDSLPVTAWWKLLLMRSMSFQPECIYVYNKIYVYIYIYISKKQKSSPHAQVIGVLNCSMVKVNRF